MKISKNEPLLVYDKKKKKMFINGKIAAYYFFTHGLPSEVLEETFNKLWMSWDKGRRLRFVLSNLKRNDNATTSNNNPVK